jgi:hypothetical protein
MHGTKITVFHAVCHVWAAWFYYPVDASTHCGTVILYEPATVWK